MPSDSDSSKVLGQFIPLHYHYNMLRDPARVTGFKKAIQHLVPEGGKVVELGGGSGILSSFAAQRASKVWCVERNPELVAAAKKFRSLNPTPEKIEIVEMDAMDFTPPEPVHLVVCEMIHVALIREKQGQVIKAFKENYRKKFPDQPLPLFTPEAAILAFQPVQQCFDFAGFYAPVPMFYDPLVIQNETQVLAAPYNYQMVVYDQEYPLSYSCDITLTMEEAGELNALRFITKNVLAVLMKEQTTVDWFSQYLIVPIEQPFRVAKGQQIRFTFQYESGDELQALTGSLKISSVQ
jgi:type I protein arginine methyltransferase